MESINSYRPISFTSRCVQIRDAQWVCHKVNTLFPHKSTTRMHPMIAKLYARTFDTPPGFEKVQLGHLRELLRLNLPTKEELTQLPYTHRIKLFLSKYCRTPEQERNIKILQKAKDFIDKLANQRDKYNSTENVTILHACIDMCSTHKIGNCSEDAVIAEFLLKLNGIKNATYASLLDTYNEKSIDHAVCVFNRDGSEFDGKITKHTIIVDPWAGFVDFAHNITSFYKNQMSDSIKMAKDAKIEYIPKKSVSFDEDVYEKMREQFPQLVFPNTSRGFMQNKMPHSID